MVLDAVLGVFRPWPLKVVIEGKICLPEEGKLPTRMLQIQRLFEEESQP